MNLSDRDLEILSAYLDREISRNDRERLEARLLVDAELSNTLEGLQRTKQVMRSLPSMRAPRNYYLTPEMVGRKEPVSRAFPVLRLASVLASVLFILLFLGDMLVPRPGAVSTLKAVQVGETIMEAAEAPLIERQLPEEQADQMVQSTPTREDVVESEVEEAPMMESELPEAMEEPSMEIAPNEGEAAAPLLEPTAGPPSEPPAELERMMATGVPAPADETKVFEELAEISPTPGLPEEAGANGIAFDNESQPTVNLWLIVRYFEIVLIVVALTTGLAALFLFRRNKFTP
jgi:hypothetical protein